MRDTVDLQQPGLLPDDFRRRLRAIDPLCCGHECSETLVKVREVAMLVDDLNNYCMERRILGIHYTRAIREDIELKGLLVRTGNAIRTGFLDRFGLLFDSDELEFLRNKWENHQVTQAHVRDLKLCFNFTTEALGTSGTKRLLGQYGGEQINMGIEFDSSIGKKLASIGEPLIVKCSLDPRNVKTYITNPWGKILLSSYHRQVRADAIRLDQDGSQTTSVLPEDLNIEAVH